MIALTLASYVLYVPHNFALFDALTANLLFFPSASHGGTNGGTPVLVQTGAGLYGVPSRCVVNGVCHVIKCLSVCTRYLLSTTVCIRGRGCQTNRNVPLYYQNYMSSNSYIELTKM